MASDAAFIRFKLAQAQVCSIIMLVCVASKAQRLKV